MDDRGAVTDGVEIPNLILYSRADCRLCDEARAIIRALLQVRATDGSPTPAFVERDITGNPEWERAFFMTIPVVELGDRRLELATSVVKLRALLGTLDNPSGPV